MAVIVVVVVIVVVWRLRACQANSREKELTFHGITST